jgi:transposase-like protein
MNVVSEERLIRRWVDQLRPFGRGRTYTPKLRERIIKFVELAKAAGINEADCCKSIGVSPTSVRSWRRSEDRELPPEAAVDAPFETPLELSVEPLSKELVPIEVTPSPLQLGGGLSLVTPRGIRIEGLSLEQAFALLREFV